MATLILVTCLLYLCTCFIESHGTLLSRKSLMYPSHPASLHVDPYSMISWNDGEVSWDFIQMNDDEKENQTMQTNININTKIRDVNLNSVSPNLNKPTPLYNKIISDQDIIATTSAIVKLSHKELINTENIFSQLSSNFDSTILFTPSEMFILTVLSGLTFVYNKSKETEIVRLKKLYKFNLPNNRIYER